MAFEDEDEYRSAEYGYERIDVYRFESAGSRRVHSMHRSRL